MTPAGTRRDEVLAVVRASPHPLGVTEIAARLQVHPNTVRFHLDGLVDAGRVERVTLPPTGPGRPKLVFRARPGMDPAGRRNYRLLAAALAGGVAAGPDPAGAASAAGRAWGSRLLADTAQASSDREGVHRLVALLDDLGFDPEWPAAGRHAARIGLRHCPFLEVARTDAQVVCPLHLGLMQGALAALAAPVDVERLEPFAAPDLCLAHLSAAPATEDADPGEDR